MNKNRIFILGTALVATTLAADLPLGGTAPLAANGSKRRVNASVETTTQLVSAPVVEKKIEETQTWVPEVTESATAEVFKLGEEPYRPIIPIATFLTSLDCNNNGTPDSGEILSGAMDWDNDGVLDSCEYAMGDLNLNGLIDGQDISILLGWWGVANPLFGDLDSDNAVGPRDLGILLGRFGVVVY